jgi:uncharacterized protein (DUF697 family)
MPKSSKPSSETAANAPKPSATSVKSTVKPAKKSSEHALANSPEAIAERCRAILNRRALSAAAASVVPVPGLGFALDVVLLGSLLDTISSEFGLSAGQLAALPQARRQQAFSMIQMSGNFVIGKVISVGLVTQLLGMVGVRVTTKRVAKYIPLIGQAASAALGYAITKKLGETHIQDCLVLHKQLLLPSSASRSTRGKNAGDKAVEDVSFVDR